MTPIPPASDAAATSSGLLHGYMAPQISGTSMPSWRVSGVSRRLATLFLDRHAAPEGDVVLDVGRRRLGVRVVPGGVRVLQAVHGEGVVARRPLPAADRVGVARLEKFSLDGIGREIDIPLDRLIGVRLGDHLSVPDGFRDAL